MLAGLLQHGYRAPLSLLLLSCAAIWLVSRGAAPAAPRQIPSAHDDTTPGWFLDCSNTVAPSHEAYVEKQCVLPAAAPGTHTIACVGDSITLGAGGDPGGYPRLLHERLRARGLRYNVVSFGESGATLQRSGNSPYTARASWPRLLAAGGRLDTIVLMAGTNDAKTGLPERGEAPNWRGEAAFASEYAWMLSQLAALPARPRLLAVTPVPLYPPNPFTMQPAVINDALPRLVAQAAAEAGAQLLDGFGCLGGAALARPELFADGCHPNAHGYAVLADCVQQALLGR